MFDLSIDLSSLPPNTTTHFEPNDDFLDWFASYVAGRFTIEAGAGQCEFSKALIQLGVKVMAVEPRPSPEVLRGSSNFLLPCRIQACTLVQNPGIVVVVARPDHSGWFAELADMVSPESELIYIGLDKNYDLDIPEHFCTDELFGVAGADGEVVLRVRRSDA
jgi:hypothetical protein